MPEYITSIHVTGLHNRFQLTQEFQSGINVVHGENGVGKTTLLHILTNLLNGKYGRFAFLDFTSIEVRFDDETNVTIVRDNLETDSQIRIYTDEVEIEFSEKEARFVEQRLNLLQSVDRTDPRIQQFLDKFKNVKSPISTAYFPAFRTMIEAWTSFLFRETSPKRSDDIRYSDIYSSANSLYARMSRSVAKLNDEATRLARDLFGNFVPTINYPSPINIEISLQEEFEKALFNVARGDQELLSQTFLDTFAALSKETTQVKESPEDIRSEMRMLIGKLETFPYGVNDTINNKIYRNLLNQIDIPIAETHYPEMFEASVLDIYRKALRKRYSTQVGAFEGIEKYFSAVNEFLKGKEITLDSSDQGFSKPTVKIKFDDGTTTRLQALSSGERQIITMIYAASQMSAQKLVLIDEPEISLHVDWQRRLLRKLSEQIPNRQIIVCTHSPVIGADYRGRREELQLIPIKNFFPPISEQSSDEEDVLF